MLVCKMPAYPQAHLLGLPIELRDIIYDHLASTSKVLHIWDRKTALHLSTSHAPLPSLLQAHPILHREALAHFHRTQCITLHVDAFAFACLSNPKSYANTLRECHYVRNARELDLRPTLNASITFLSDAMDLAVPTLLSSCPSLKTVRVTWAESIPHPIARNWRPWVYKQVSLMPLWDLLGRVELVYGGVINAPPAAIEEQEQGLYKFMTRLTKNQDLFKVDQEDLREVDLIFAVQDRNVGSV